MTVHLLEQAMGYQSYSFVEYLASFALQGLEKFRFSWLEVMYQGRAARWGPLGHLGHLLGFHPCCPVPDEPS